MLHNMTEEDWHPAQHNTATVQWIVACLQEVNGLCHFRLPTREKTSRSISSLSAPCSCLGLLLLCLFLLFLSTFCFNFPLYSSISWSYFLHPIIFLLLSVVPQSSCIIFPLSPSSSFPSYFSTSSLFSLLPYSLQFLPLFFLHAARCSVTFVSLCVNSLFVKILFVNNLFVNSLLKASLLTKLRLAGQSARGRRQLRTNAI